MNGDNNPVPGPARRPAGYRRVNQSHRHGQRDPTRESADLTRITINLTPRTVNALDELRHSGGGSKTDTINRAVQVTRLLRRYADETGVTTIVGRDGRQIDIEVI